jgi:hypothetical protein
MFALFSPNGRRESGDNLKWLLPFGGMEQSQKIKFFDFS